MPRPNQTLLDLAREAAERGEWEYANNLLEGFGMEFVFCGGRELKYINLGDTYSTTICAEKNLLPMDGISSDAYQNQPEFYPPFIGSWGDWYEETENEYCEEEGVIRCGYCSEFTPLEENKNWPETVCQHCGHLVGG